jgi:prepilin-type N-terminal cleavage/methylation domain-containing protein
MTSQQLKKKAEGFTIIEVLIVLAIAGLILLIVFLAVPALQRNSRNTEARSEASRIIGALSEFISNNNGKAPVASVSTTPGSDAAKVLANASLRNITTLRIEAETGTSTPNASTAVVRLVAKCNAANNETDPGAGRQTAVLFQVENSSGVETTCTDT